MAERAIAGDSVVDLHDQACPQRRIRTSECSTVPFWQELSSTEDGPQQCPMPKALILTSSVVSP